MRWFAVLLTLTSSPAFGDTLVAARTLPARTIIEPEDLVLHDATIVGGLDQVDLVVGQEARVALYAGRPIRSGDIGPPAVVERNQIVMLVYQRGGILISRIVLRTPAGSGSRA